MRRMTVDRIAGEWAVCVSGQGAIRRVPVDDLPAGACEGTVLAEGDDGTLSLDEEMTARLGRYVESELYYEHEDGSPEMREGMGGPASGTAF